MSTTIATPEATETCAYCGARIFDHDPVCGSPAYFCNYACLSVHIDEEELAVGDACTLAAGGDCC